MDVIEAELDKKFYGVEFVSDQTAALSAEEFIKAKSKEFFSKYRLPPSFSWRIFIIFFSEYPLLFKNSIISSDISLLKNRWKRSEIIGKIMNTIIVWFLKLRKIPLKFQNYHLYVLRRMQTN